MSGTIDQKLTDFAHADGVAEAKRVLERTTRAKAGMPPHGLPGLSSTRGGVTLQAEADWSIADLFDFHRLNPLEWVIKRVRPRMWTNAAVIDKEWVEYKLHLIGVDLEPQAKAAVMASLICDGHAGARAPSEYAVPTTGLVSVFSDHQVKGPGLGYDPVLHELILRFLQLNQPRWVIFNGDVDNGTAGSQWDEDPEEPDVNSSWRATHRLAADYREAVGWDTRIDWTMGNHECHYLRSMLRKNPKLAKARRGGDPTAPLLFSQTNMFGLDSLGIIEAPGHYPHSYVQVGKYTLVGHGNRVRNASGASGIASLQHVHFCRVIGHTHRQGLTFETAWEIGGRRITPFVMEGGTCCAITREGQGYSDFPNWMGGFSNLWLYPDGITEPSLARYINGCLTWGRQRFWMKRGKVFVEY